ncbi:hypothetical protein [Nocardia australiensis]|uniref:hypothetical protein n=1 Tax=Nocardia australiensis TaxID=2887191 RepID=UPI001D15770F|nr:hypothetical protein [Nocardia australiensis]
MSRYTLRTTETRDGKLAQWRLVDRNVRVVRLRIATDSSQAYQYPGRPLPTAQPGSVFFDDERLPDLAQVREWFPKHETLWNAVREEYWAALLNMADLPADAER